MTDQVSRQEADRMLAAALSASQDRWEAHVREHEHHTEVHESEHSRDRDVARLREESVEKAFAAHVREHEDARDAVRTALASVGELARVHALAHEREHASHEQRHADQAEATRRDDQAMDKRLAGLNSVYDQMRDQAARFASQEAVVSLQAQLDRRFDESRRERDLANETLRGRIETLEKGGVKAEGRQLGMGTLAAIIVGVVTFIGTVLGILILLANLVTSG